MRTVLLPLFAVFALAGRAAAQARPRATLSLESGGAVLSQPLVRSGAAVYVAPGTEVSLRGFTIGANAVLAAGSPVWQSFLGTGFARTPSVAGIRLTGSAQGLKTSGLAETWHNDVGIEWSRSTPTTAGTLRARGGLLQYREQWWPDMDVGATVAHSHGASVFALDASMVRARRSALLQSQLGVTPTGALEFTARTIDVTPRVMWERGRLRADASVALRVDERGMRGTRVGPQLSLTVAASRGMSVFVGGVHRLPDVRSGLPSGRSALLGLRLENTGIFSRGRRSAAETTPALRVERGTLLLDVGPHVTTRAAIRGDFTGWQERGCTTRGGTAFDCGRAPAAGTWRVAVKLNDGAWQQPRNLAAVADDFGSVDGVLMTGGRR